MRRMGGSWLGEVVGRSEGEHGRRGNSICKSMLKTERDSVWLRRSVRDGVMGQGKVCGCDPEGEGLRQEHVKAFTSQRSWLDKGTDRRQGHQ